MSRQMVPEGVPADRRDEGKKKVADSFPGAAVCREPPWMGEFNKRGQRVVNCQSARSSPNILIYGDGKKRKE